MVKALRLCHPRDVINHVWDSNVTGWRDWVAHNAAITCATRADCLLVRVIILNSFVISVSTCLSQPHLPDCVKMRIAHRCVRVARMKTAPKLSAALSTALLATACTPLPPVGYDGLDGVSAKAVTVIFGAPLVDDNWDSKDGPVTWRHEIVERHKTPRRIFSNGQFLYDGYTTHEFLLTCDLTAQLRDGRLESATLVGPRRACDAVRAEAQKVAALIEVLQEEGQNGASQ